MMTSPAKETETSQRHSAAPSNRVFGQVCPACGRSFAWPSTLVNHVLVAHGTIACDYAKGFHNEFYRDKEGRFILEEWCDGDEEPIDTHMISLGTAVTLLAPKLAEKEWKVLPSMVKEAV